MPAILQPRHFYDAPHECIYCGDQQGPFSDEHIVPRNMGGALVFRDASCLNCARTINKEIETPISNMVGAFRRRVLPARNREKKRRPATSALDIYDAAGNITSHTVPSGEMPRVLYLPAFPPPALLRPHARFILPEMWTRAHRADLRAAEAKFGGVSHAAGRYDLDKFSRQLAKIAHAYLAAEFPEMNRYEKLLPKYILTGIGDARGLVGGELFRIPSEKFIYRIVHSKDVVAGTEYLVVVFRLFAFMGGPVYQVVAARRPSVSL